MVALYCKLIIAKRKTFDQIPVNFQNDVKKMLLGMGYDTNGEPVNSMSSLEK